MTENKRSLLLLCFTLLTLLFIEASQGATYATGLVRPKTALNLPHITPVLEVGETLPAQFDWREKGLSPIQNQGSCGSCWAFSVTATARDALKLAGKDEALSQQFLVDCDKQAYGCGGGYFTAFDLVKNPGSPLLSDYPYRASNGRCRQMPPAAKISSWAYVGTGTEPSIIELKTAIYKYGPISVTVTADQSFMNYQGGVYKRCRSGQTNHMTNLVGWNDTTHSWIMRNSWGESWGEKGFMEILYTDSRGQKCNDIGQEAAFVQIGE